MATSTGVIQGDTGVAAVDARRQIIVDAQAHGTGSEHELLLPVVQALQEMLAPTSLVTADAGSHSAANLQQLATLGVEALIADPDMRTCVCPAGQSLYRKGRALVINGFVSAVGGRIPFNRM